MYITPPEKPLSEKAFSTHLLKRGFRLDAKSRLLFSGTQFFVNGEDFGATGKERQVLTQLADDRALPAGDYGNALAGLLYEWYLAGWGDIA